jgi:hypothetical protein
VGRTVEGDEGIPRTEGVKEMRKLRRALVVLIGVALTMALTASAALAGPTTTPS